ncbi:sigma-70 family RNA polymerase sigma factor [Streptococcus entericus]|uniref:sigma-70 family RNA polymerase sigma factor n=1 Tax=Streptococcus entericus TaxID=155680 RepID=UPI00037171C9|nr:sigma-70 family RNA polymerase sigma factor [Streptococcus entericus]
MDKVKQRRETAIRKALEQDDWNKILHLLSQEEENLERKERKYGGLSLDYLLCEDSQDSVLEQLASPTLNPEELLVQKETNLELYQALSELSDIQFGILLGKALYKKSFRQLGRDFGVSGHTAKARYESTLAKLLEKLSDKNIF